MAKRTEFTLRFVARDCTNVQPVLDRLFDIAEGRDEKLEAALKASGASEVEDKAVVSFRVKRPVKA